MVNVKQALDIVKEIELWFDMFFTCERRDIDKVKEVVLKICINHGWEYHGMSPTKYVNDKQVSVALTIENMTMVFGLEDLKIEDVICIDNEPDMYDSTNSVGEFVEYNLKTGQMSFHVCK